MISFLLILIGALLICKGSYDLDTAEVQEQTEDDEMHLLTACHLSAGRDMIRHGYRPDAEEVLCQAQHMDVWVPDHHTKCTHRLRRN